MKYLSSLISDVAKKYCADYPNISLCDSAEQLYAIESALDGVSQANNDLHSVIKKLRERLGMSLEEYSQLIENVCDNEQSTKVSCIKVLVTLKSNKTVPVFMPEQVYDDATKCLDYLSELFTEQGWISQGLAE